MIALPRQVIGRCPAAWQGTVFINPALVQSWSTLFGISGRKRSERAGSGSTFFGISADSACSLIHLMWQGGGEAHRPLLHCSNPTQCQSGCPVSVGD